MYSQYAEDEVILKIFSDMPHGRVLDIGAWMPTTFSNSRALIERGWDAVLIEPSPGPLRDLVKFYGSDPTKGLVSIIGAAVGLEPGLMDLAITDDAVSTSSAVVASAWATAGGYIGRMLAPVLLLEQISNQFGGFDFISIDAEGISVDLAKRMLDLGWEPSAVMVEHDGRLPELLQAFTAKGYVAVLANGTNVLVRR